jgi:hypothetical protein
MSYKKHVQVVPTSERLQKALQRSQRYFDSPTPGGMNNKFSSFLPEVYAGHPQRIERYGQYDNMDGDSDINSALDTIADFSTRKDANSDETFKITWRTEASDTEVEILKTCLRQWSKINEWKKRAWRLFRNTIKYGDQFFVRDPETMKLNWVDPSKVEKVLVNEAKGKEPEAYVIKQLDLNLQALTATSFSKYGQNFQGTSNQGLNPRGTAQAGGFGGATAGSSTSGRFGNQDQDASVVEAHHVVHISMSEGMDAGWPFGTSILESVFKVFQQKTLIEDAILIYRIQRAPERRVFYIDVGNMPVHRTGSYLEKVKNEIHQRRFPSRTGGGASVVDATYNPMSMMEDFFFAQTADGRGSRVDTLPGGENLGQIDDLKFWTNRLLRGLRVPSSYIPTSPEDGMQTFTDGRVGTAYIQEFRFAQYCERLQNLIIPTLDDEFKLFVRQRGYQIDSGSYELNFQTPESFNEFARVERDAAMIDVFAPLAELPYFSKRWLMLNKLGMSEQEITEMEAMWLRENPDLTQNISADSVNPKGPPGLESVGVQPEGDFDDMGDEDGEDGMDTGEDGASDGESPISGGENNTQDDGDNPLA